MRYEREVIPKKLAMVRYPSLYDTMRGVRRNKETFSVGLLEDTHAVKNSWGLVSYGVNSKLLYYCRLGSKESTSSSTLDSLGNFISEHRIPRMIIPDNNGVLGAEKKLKRYLRKKITPFRISETDKHNQNPIERAIKILKFGLSKIRDDCGKGSLNTIARRWSIYAILTIIFPGRALVTSFLMNNFGGGSQIYQ